MGATGDPGGTAGRRAPRSPYVPWWHQRNGYRAAPHGTRPTRVRYGRQGPPHKEQVLRRQWGKWAPRATRGARGAACAEITLRTLVAPTGAATERHNTGHTGRTPPVSAAVARDRRMKNKWSDVNGVSGRHGRPGGRAGRRAPRSPYVPWWHQRNGHRAAPHGARPTHVRCGRHAPQQCFEASSVFALRGHRFRRV
jgi:hypothetical protein